ncbi:MAG: naringenin-chalcone synthase [Leptolyngbyaceae cyanobacterium CRU_2_3]|nr:naringenin-chalcone synthase [Leptolyngbyaceae cyanobacterium CRU_2_3]
MNAKTTQKAQELTSSLSIVQPTRIKSEPNFDELGADRLPSKRFLPIIESIATGTPHHIIRQSDAAKFVANLPDLEQNQSRIEKLYSNTRIETRHLAVNLLSHETIAFSRQQGTLQTRMELYKQYAVPLAEQVVSQAVASARAASEVANLKDAIGLIVFVSSTGFVAPGVDAELIKRLGLRRDIARVTVNFMGCAAAMNGLRVACDHVRANPTHKALVVCLELSSVNAVFEDEINDVIIHSIFGDGCAAVVVGACAEEQTIGQGKVVIRDHLSYLIEDTEDGITLGIRDNGITCQLSRQLPNYIEAGVNSVIERFLASHHLTKADIDLWAVHPGGTRIIEKAQHSLGLNDSQVADSWEVLRQYGNMLSSSVLFVMERMLLKQESLPAKPESSESGNLTAKAVTGLAFSFSPGVGIEGLLFQKV